MNQHGNGAKWIAVVQVCHYLVSVPDSLPKVGEGKTGTVGEGKSSTVAYREPLWATAGIRIP